MQSVSDEVLLETDGEYRNLMEMEEDSRYRKRRSGRSIDHRPLLDTVTDR